MYGLVNAAIADLARQVGGEDTWEAVRERAGISQVAFVGMTAYPDDVTYRLVSAASEVLAMPAEEVLRVFGRHWVRYTVDHGWGPLLSSTGSTLAEVLSSLDDMHARVHLMMPELSPPSFECADVTDTGLRLLYRSDRPGLAPMVVGLVEGLAELLGTPARVRQTAFTGLPAEAPCDHDEFLVEHVAT